MEYTLKLYRNVSENRDVIKTLENETVITGSNRGAIDKLAPEIFVVDVAPNTFNYCYIVELQRYYYIEGFQIDHKGVALLHMKVDVLMTYADDIKASSGLITKQRDYNPYYGDYNVEERTQATRIDFNDVFDYEGEFVLVALRG